MSIKLIIFSIIFYFVLNEVVKAAGGVYTADIINYYDQSYMIKVQIGNPPQNFNVLLSTGSADFWVLHSSIKTNKQRFFSQKSSTYSNSSKFMVIGNVEGFVGVDTVQFAGLKLNKIEFNQVDIIDSITLKQPFEGALGLAYPSLSKSKTVSPVMTAIQQNLFANKMFTLYLKGGYGPNAENKYGGRVTFGDFDFQNCGKIMGWTNISPQIHYQFQIDSISFNGKVVSGKTQAIAESSTSVIMGDKAVTDNLAKQVGGVWDENEGLYILPCNKNYSPITIKINKIKLVLTKDILTFQLNSNKCAFAIIPADPAIAEDGYNWIIGSPLMRAYCHTFDIGNNRLGFAQVLKK